MSEVKIDIDKRGPDRYNAIALLIPCRHLFCLDCMGRWTNESIESGQWRDSDGFRTNTDCCPLCRQEISLLIPTTRPIT